MRALTLALTLGITLLACSAANAAVVRVGRVAVGVRAPARVVRPVVVRPARPAYVAPPVVVRPARPAVIRPAAPVRPAIRAHRHAVWHAIH